MNNSAPILGTDSPPIHADSYHYQSMPVISITGCSNISSLNPSCDNFKNNLRIIPNYSGSNIILPSERNELQDLVDTLYAEIICSAKYEHFFIPHKSKTVKNNSQNTLENISFPAHFHKLLSNKTTENLEERIRTLMDQYPRATESFLTQDLVKIADVLHLLLKKKTAENNYQTYITEFLKKARNAPIIIGRNNIECHSDIDKQNLIKILEHYLTKVAELMTETDDEQIQIDVVKVFLSLFARSCQVENTIKLENLLQSLEESTVLNTFCENLETISRPVYILLLNFFLALGDLSETSSLYIISRGCIDIVIGRMAPSDPCNMLLIEQGHLEFKMQYQSLVKLSISLINHLLKCYEHSRLKMDIVISTKAIHNLFNILDQAIHRENNVLSKEIRNHLLSNFVKLQQLFSNKGVQLAINQLHLAEQIIYLGIPKRHLQNKNSKKDFDDQEKAFSKLLVLCKYYVLRFNSETVSHEAKCHLASYCVPDVINDSEYMKYCFIIGRKFIPHLKEEFLKTHGCAKLLKILSKLLKKSSRSKVLFEVLKTLDLLVYMSENTQILKCLIENGTMGLLICVSNLLLREKALKVEKIALIYTFHAMSRLIQDNIDDQETYSEDFNNIFSDTFKIVRVNNTFNMTTDEQLLTVVLIFLSKSITPNPTSSEKFAKCGLIFKLLDLLSLNVNVLTENVLRILIDLCDSHNHALGIPFVLTWREPNSGKCFLAKVCDLWREYEEGENVRRDPHGMISDLEFPLMGESQRKQLGNKSRPYFEESCSSIRDILFSLVDLMREQVETVGNQYQIGTRLDVKDQLTMVIIENYVVLKQHEMWQEIGHTFNTQGKVINNPTANLLKEVSESAKRRVGDVLNQQLKIWNHEKSLRYNSEEHLYTTDMKRQTEPTWERIKFVSDTQKEE